MIASSQACSHLSMLVYTNHEFGRTAHRMCEQQQSQRHRRDREADACAAHRGPARLEARVEAH
eukprot:2725969-Pleurochrysis_carterae.AAC.2